MPHKCCVPNCKGNYHKRQRVSVFMFPKDPVLKQKWLKAIRRKDFTPNKSSRVSKNIYLELSRNYNMYHYSLCFLVWFSCSENAFLLGMREALWKTFHWNGNYTYRWVHWKSFTMASSQAKAGTRWVKFSISSATGSVCLQGFLDRASAFL